MTRELHFDPSREPLPPDDELWGGEPPDASAPDDAPDAHAEALDATLRALARQTYHVDGLPAGDTVDTSDARGGDGSVPRDAMWAAISVRRPPRAEPVLGADVTAPPVTVHRLSPRAAHRLWPVFAALAATLAIGVAIGRGIEWREAGTGARVAQEEDSASDRLPVLLAQLTSEHLGRTEALLMTARHDFAGAGSIAGSGDGLLAEWARDLLSTTRLLLDTEQLTDPYLRKLLQDLELTLALILQAQASGRAADVQAVHEELDTGDLLLRVRSASLPIMLPTDDVREMSE